MADLDFVDETLFDPDEAPITEPPKRWRNWWRALVGGQAFCVRCGKTETLEAGGLYAGCGIFPSKDAAETSAQIQMTEGLGGFGPIKDKYEGAYREGERP